MIVQDVQTALDQFAHYHEIWQLDMDDELQEFMQNKPGLPEFESEILHYEELEYQIMNEAEHYDVGPIALFTGTDSYVIKQK